ncbi:MAG: MBL fold metallo-hydrolase [Hormoscilla sp. GM102CHS1]|nr:MBL fold metallo-hydrolase [Hormoscilla sp. GM102CHS1]
MLIELGDKRILLDPWLVGDLVFGNLTWFFKGSRPQPRPIPENIDLIILSQGLEDIYLKPDKVLSRLQSVADRNSQKVGLEENQIYSKVDCHPGGPRPAKDKSSHRLAIRDAPCNRIVS